MAANHRRRVHRLQAEDPLYLSALEEQVYPLEVIGLTALTKPSSMRIQSKMLGKEEISDFFLLMDMEAT